MEIDIQDIIDDFEFLESWEERLRYVVELGRELPPMPEEYKVDENRMYGCQSRVWIRCDRSNSAEPILTFCGASDAQIVQGLITIVFSIVNGQTPQFIASYDIKGLFEQLDLANHLTPSRANGLNQLVETVKQAALNALITT